MCSNYQFSLSYIVPDKCSHYELLMFFRDATGIIYPCIMIFHSESVL